MKRISLLVCTLAIGMCSFAQTASLGFKGGLNIATLSHSTDQWGSRAGIHAGLLAHVHVSPTFAVQPEIVYSSQGADYTINVGGNDESHSLGLNYVNIPVLGQYMFRNGFRLETGPQVGFLTKVTDKVSGNETGFFSTDDFKTVDVSWSAGLGYMARSGLGVDARYNFGLTNVIDAGGAIRKNNVFQLGLFYQLPSSR
jgi:hypothetical protein